jgi:hypothetical protein
MSQPLMSRKFSVTVSDADWENLTDDQMNSLIEQIDAVMMYAEDYISDKLRGVTPRLKVRSTD